MRADVEVLKHWKSGIHIYDVIEEEDAVEFLYKSLKEHDLVEYESIEEFKKNIMVNKNEHNEDHVIRRFLKLLRNSYSEKFHSEFYLKGLFDIAKGHPFHFFIRVCRTEVTLEGVEWETYDECGVSGEIVKEPREDKFYTQYMKPLIESSKEKKPWWRWIFG